MDKTKNKSGGSGVDASTIKNYSQEEKYKAEVSMLKLFISKFNKYVSQVVKENPCDKTRKIDNVWTAIFGSSLSLGVISCLIWFCGLIITSPLII
jgi:hypothetical protein